MSTWLVILLAGLDVVSILLSILAIAGVVALFVVGVRGSDD